jgi:hypothetical protein
MPTFKDYYKDLLIWENVVHTELVEEWPAALVAAVHADIQQSVSSGSIIGLRCPIREESTNQSIGNQVEVFVLPKLAAGLKSFKLAKCSGAGYPDEFLKENNTNLKMPLEVKATSDWNPKDSNRRVLTSTSEKIRKEFRYPIYHLLLTILYRINTDSAVVENIRLDYLEPSTQVSVRLEASVNHKILSNGKHKSFTI